VSYSWNADDSRRWRREGATSDVVDDGMSEIGAAARWGVQVDDVRRWVEEVRTTEPDES
jgi:hypothetical protein